MSKATHPLKLLLSVKQAAQRPAKEDGVSLNQWIAAAVAEKVGVMETAAEFFQKCAGSATGAGLMKFLKNAPKVPPEPGDAMRCVRPTGREVREDRRPHQPGRPPIGLIARFRVKSRGPWTAGPRYLLALPGLGDEVRGIQSKCFFNFADALAAGVIQV